MSRIGDLIAGLCPDGVEFRELRDVFTTRNGYTPLRSEASFWADGTVPWFRMDDIRENGRVLDRSLQQVSTAAVRGKLFPANSIIVATSATIGEHALVTVPHLSNQRFTSLAVKPAFAERLDAKFAFYYCFVLDEWCKANTTTSSFAAVDMNGFKRFPFPIPPLEVQREIVRILDTFTDLEEELGAELEARSAQYAHYRDLLFAFPEETSVPWTPMGEVGEFQRGKRITKNDFVEAGVGAIHYGEVYTHYGTSATETRTFVTPTLAARLRKARRGDLVIAATGETVEDVCKAVAWLGDDEVAIHDDCYLFRHSVNPKYVAYFFQSAAFQAQKVRYTAGAKVVRVSGAGLERMRIPVPDAREQERIVRILDRFDALVGDPSIGLPAELRARRRQYEHYRDRLLTFEPAAA